MTDVSKAAIEAGAKALMECYGSYAFGWQPQRASSRAVLAAATDEALGNDALLVLGAQERDLLREALWHAVQRGDIPDDERQSLHELHERFARAAALQGTREPS